eukprot:scaffold25198_cov112-Isochrysis_galbana.AAC.2
MAAPLAVATPPGWKRLRAVPLPVGRGLLPAPPLLWVTWAVVRPPVGARLRALASKGCAREALPRGPGGGGRPGGKGRPGDKGVGVSKGSPVGKGTPG